MHDYIRRPPSVKAVFFTGENVDEVSRDLKIEISTTTRYDEKGVKQTDFFSYNRPLRRNVWVVQEDDVDFQTGRPFSTMDNDEFNKRYQLRNPPQYKAPVFFAETVIGERMVEDAMQRINEGLVKVGTPDSILVAKAEPPVTTIVPGDFVDKSNVYTDFGGVRRG